jgi:hypothetical protein
MTTAIQFIPLDEALPGMVLAENVVLTGEQILLPKTTTLSAAHIARLQQCHVQKISIVSPADCTTTTCKETAEDIRREVHAMFRRSGEDPVNLALCKTVLEYRLEKTA